MENESGEQSSDHPSEMKQLLSAIETLQTAVEELSSGREDERELRVERPAKGCDREYR